MLDCGTTPHVVPTVCGTTTSLVFSSPYPLLWPMAEWHVIHPPTSFFRWEYRVNPTSGYNLNSMSRLLDPVRPIRDLYESCHCQWFKISLVYVLGMCKRSRKRIIPLRDPYKSRRISDRQVAKEKISIVHRKPSRVFARHDILCRRYNEMH